MNNYILKILVIFLVGSFYTVNAQCDEDPDMIAMKNELYGVRFSKDGSYEGYDLCRRYYFYKCLAQLDYYESDGVKHPRTEYDAKRIDDMINRIIDDYNRLGNKKCGEMQPIQAKYSDSLSNRKDIVVGYWVSKDNVGGRVNYTDFYFSNDQKFRMNLYPNNKQRANWEKTAENTYKITFQSYSDYKKDWNDPQYSTFTVHPSSCSATYSLVNHQGKTITSTWYFKGGAYNVYGRSEEEILAPKDCKL